MQIGEIKPLDTDGTTPDINVIQEYAQKLSTSEVQTGDGTDIQKFLKVDFDKEIKNLQEKTDLKLTDVKNIIDFHIYKDKDIQGKLEGFEKKVLAKRAAEGEQRVNNSVVQRFYKTLKAMVDPEGRYAKHTQVLKANLGKEYKNLEKACSEAQKKQSLIRELFAESPNYKEIFEGSEKMEEVAETFYLQGKSNGLCILAMLELCKEQESLALDNLPSYYSTERQGTLKLLTLLVTLPKIGGELRTSLDPSAWMEYPVGRFSDKPEYTNVFTHLCISKISEIQKNSLYDNLSYQEIKESLQGLYYNALLIQSLDGLRSNDLDTEEKKQIVGGRLNKILGISKESFPVLANSKVSIVEHGNFQKLFKLFENDPIKYWDHFKQKSPLNKLFTQVSYLCDDMIQLDLLVKGAEKFENLKKTLSEFEVVPGNNNSEAFTSSTEISQEDVSMVGSPEHVADEIRKKYSAIEKRIEALKKLKTQGEAEFPPLKSGDNVEIDLTGLRNILENPDSENLNNEEDFLSMLDNLINIKKVEEEVNILKQKAEKIDVNFDIVGGLAEAAKSDAEALGRQESGYGSDSGESTPGLDPTASSDELIKKIAKDLVEKIIVEAVQTTRDRSNGIQGDFSSSDSTVVNSEAESIVKGLVDELIDTVVEKEASHPAQPTDENNQHQESAKVSAVATTTAKDDSTDITDGDNNSGANKTAEGSEIIITPKKGNKMRYALALAPVVLLAALVIAKVALSITSLLGENLLKTLPSLGMNNPVINKENIFIFLPVAVFLTLITCATIYCAQKAKPGSNLCDADGKSVNEKQQR